MYGSYSNGLLLSLLQEKEGLTGSESEYKIMYISHPYKEIIMNIDLNDSFEEISKIEPFNSLGSYLIFGGYKKESQYFKLRLCDVHEISWNTETVLCGLNRLQELGDMTENIHPVYSEEECAADPAKKDVHVTFLPAKTEIKKKDIIILVPGGSYTDVCSVCEGYPVASRLNELGYSAFILNYRVSEEGILPKPMDDLAVAVRYLLKNAESFGLSPENYVVCGFSAGGHLTSEWGTDNHGYSSYGLPKPAAMFPIYPEVNLKQFYPQYKEGFLLSMLGKGQSEERISEYSADQHVSEKYPPCYICLCRDDDIVPPENSMLLCRALEKAGVPYHLELDEKGGHGFGDGRGTDAYGWIDRAVEYYEALKK